MPRHNTRGSSVFQNVSERGQEASRAAVSRFGEGNKSRGRFAGSAPNNVHTSTGERSAEARNRFLERFRSNQQNGGRD